MGRRQEIGGIGRIKRGPTKISKYRRRERQNGRSAERPTVGPDGQVEGHCGGLVEARELEGHSLGGKVYRPPRVLRRRKEIAEGADEKVIEADETTTGVEMRKDSRFSQSWQNFKDSNPVMNKFVDYRVKFEESDSPLARGARLLTDKVQDIFGGVFKSTELSATLTEIVKIDPTFEREKFLKECESDIIPNVLEAITRGDLEILEDWCYEAPFNLLATPIRNAKTMGLEISSRVLDIDSLDLAMGKMMEQGPVLVITFNSQQILCVKDRDGKVVEGSED